MVLGLAFIFASTALATTPNPGHPWTDVGDGTFIVTGPTTARTYTFPDANATVLTTNALVSVTQGGTGLNTVAQGDILYGSASNTLSALAKSTSATRYLANTGSSNNPAWAQVDLTNGVTGALPNGNLGTGNAYVGFSGPTSTTTLTLPNASATILTDHDLVTLAQGGTGANLSPSSGGILYSTASAAALLAGTATAGLPLRSGANDAPSWSTSAYATSASTAGKLLRSDGTNFVTSTATYPDTASTSGNLLMSDGTNFASTAMPDQKIYVPVGLFGNNLTAVTALTTGLSYFEYIGVAPRTYTSCTTLFNVTTQVATITWAEVAIFKGTPVINGNASLTLLGSTSVAATFNSTGRKSTAVTLTGAAAGDNLWVAFGSAASTPFQVRGMLADQMQSGALQTASVQPSAAGSPQATTLSGATDVGGRVAVTCS